MQDFLLSGATSFLRFLLLVANQQQFQDTSGAIYRAVSIVSGLKHSR